MRIDLPLRRLEGNQAFTSFKIRPQLVVFSQLQELYLRLNGSIWNCVFIHREG